MWEECIKHIMNCLKERDKDLPDFEKLNINEDDIDFILWSYYEFGEAMEGRPKELPDKYKGFEIKCSNCGKRIKLEQCFNQKESQEIDIYEMRDGGIGFVCNNCGNEILDCNYY